MTHLKRSKEGAVTAASSELVGTFLNNSLFNFLHIPYYSDGLDEAKILKIGKILRIGSLAFDQPQRLSVCPLHRMISASLTAQN